MGMIYNGQCCDEAKQNNDKLKWLDVKEKPFAVHGLYDFYNQKVFRRLPQEVAKNTNENVEWLCTNTAGARVRFVTDSSVLSVKSHNYRDDHMYHTTMLLDGGFDVFIRENGKQRYVSSLMSSGDRFPTYISACLGQKGVRKEIVVNLPTTGYIDKLEIGIDKDCTVWKPSDYAISKPVVYYGSSITHGYCATRSGNTYESIISRNLDCDYINLGFSGSCKGEQAMSDYIAGLDMSAFVLDYDHITHPHPNTLPRPIITCIGR